MAINEQRFGSALGKKIGPLPAGLWLGFVAVAAFLYQRRKGAARQVPDTGPPGNLSYYTTIGPGGDTTNIYGSRGLPPGSTQGHTRGPLPPVPGPAPSPGPTVQPPLRWPPPNPGPDSPGVPGGGSAGVPLPVLGAVRAAGRVPAVALAFVRSVGGGARSQAVAGMRATASRPTLRPAVRAAQQAAANAPGLVGLTALEGTPSERGRSTMPPAPALRQRPAAPRVIDHEVQRNMKHKVVA
jgi:hypothetical protein